MSEPNSQATSFLIEFARALQVYGEPTHRLEEGMTELARALNVQAHFFALPTGLFVSLESDGQRRTEVLRIEATEVDLGRLSALIELGGAVSRHEITIEAAVARVREILDAPPLYGPLVTVGAFALSSAAAGRFFGGGAAEMAVAFMVGLAVGLLTITAGRFPAVSRAFDPLAGFTVSFLAVISAAIIREASVPIVTVAGVIVLVPGLTLTVAITELARRSLVAGTARLHGALVTFLMLGFGVAAGGKAAALIVGSIPAAAVTMLPVWTEAVSVLVACVSLTVLFRAPGRDFGWVASTAIVTYLGVRLASPAVGPEIGVFVGALIAGVASNVHSRFFGKPVPLTRLPALMLLVPGGMGFLGLSKLLEQDIVAGMKTAFSVALVAIAVVTGLIVSNAIAPPSRTL